MLTHLLLGSYFVGYHSYSSSSAAGEAKLRKMPKTIKTRDGDERDAFSKRSRKYLRWRRGTLKRIKRGYNKRLRKFLKIK